MAVETTSINNNLVWRDSNNTWRWFNALGLQVTPWEFSPLNLPVDDTTGLPTAYTTTLVNASTVTFTAGADGGEVVFTGAGAEDDGVNCQLKGEQFYFAATWPAYFGCRVAANDVDQTEYVVGLCITDTDVIGAVTDGIYFRTVDGSAALYFVVEKDSVESATLVTTLGDDVYNTLEFYFDGTNVYAYVDGVLAATVAYSSASFPNDEYLTPSLAMLSGEASANTLSINWARAFQVRAAV